MQCPKRRPGPECQEATMVRETLAQAAFDWRAAPAENVSPVAYFPMVVTGLAEMAQTTLWHKKSIYGSLFFASACAIAPIAAGSFLPAQAVSILPWTDAQCRDLRPQSEVQVAPARRAQATG